MFGRRKDDKGERSGQPLDPLSIHGQEISIIHNIEDPEHITYAISSGNQAALELFREQLNGALTYNHVGRVESKTEGIFQFEIHDELYKPLQKGRPTSGVTFSKGFDHRGGVGRMKEIITYLERTYPTLEAMEEAFRQKPPVLPAWTVRAKPSPEDATTALRAAVIAELDAHHEKYPIAEKDALAAALERVIANTSQRGSNPDVQATI